jgi:hypothetical protein
MASSRKMPRIIPKIVPKISRVAFAPAMIALFSTGQALASQGPGGGPGTASTFTQLAMAIIVYGASALVVGAGLIGAARRRRASAISQSVFKRRPAPDLTGGGRRFVERERVKSRI